VLVGVDRGIAELADVRDCLASDRSAYVRALLFREGDGWFVRHISAVVGAEPAGWVEQVWPYESVALVACMLPASSLLPLCVATEDGLTVIALGALRARVPEVQSHAQRSRQPSFARHDQPRLSMPATEYRLAAVDSDHGSRQPATDMLVAGSCPSFPDVNSAWRALTEGDFSLAGVQRPPHDLAVLKVVEHQAWLGRVHVTTTRLTVEVCGAEVPACELELYGATDRASCRVVQPGTVVFELEDGLPEDAWLWLKQGTAWLDYRSIDPRSGWTAQNRTGPTGIEIDIPAEPQAAIEALLAAGEGPRLEYKSQLPGKLPAERRTALKSVAAFANGAGGGTIVFGVDRDEVTVVGVGDEDPNKLRDRLGDLVRASVIPRPDFDVKAYPIDGRTILILTVQPGASPPYALVTDPNTREKPEFFVRRGASTSPAQPADLREATLSRLRTDQT
jgi:hypothetical protein